MNRELDGEIAETIFGWKLAHVGPDAHGQNECDILTPNGVLPDGFELPRIGKIHRSYFAASYSSDWQTAITLARHVGLLSSVSSLTTPEELAEACLVVWRIDHGMEPALAAKLKKAVGEVTNEQTDVRQVPIPRDSLNESEL